MSRILVFGAICVALILAVTILFVPQRKPKSTPTASATPIPTVEVAQATPTPTFAPTVTPTIQATPESSQVVEPMSSPFVMNGGTGPKDHNLTVQVIAPTTVEQGHHEMPIVVMITNHEEDILESFHAYVTYGGWSDLENYPMVVSPSTEIYDSACGGEDLVNYCEDFWRGSIDSNATVVYSNQLFTPKNQNGTFWFLEVTVLSPPYDFRQSFQLTVTPSSN